MDCGDWWSYLLLDTSLQTMVAVRIAKVCKTSVNWETHWTAVVLGFMCRAGCVVRWHRNGGGRTQHDWPVRSLVTCTISPLPA